jgi:hypothetical protein
MKTTQRKTVALTLNNLLPHSIQQTISLNYKLSDGSRAIDRKYRIDPDNWMPPDTKQFYSLNQYLLDDDVINIMENYVSNLDSKFAKNYAELAQSFFHPSTMTYPTKALEYGFEDCITFENATQAPITLSKVSKDDMEKYF